MKTTIEIDDGLLKKTRRLAAERNVTMRSLVESALRQMLNNSVSKRAGRFRLRRHTCSGEGLQQGLDAHDWSRIRDRAYEGRGG